MDKISDNAADVPQSSIFLLQFNKNMSNLFQGVIKPQNILLRILFVFCVSFYTSAQYRFDSWTTDNGLPQNSVYAIAQTPDGYLWLTTLDGLARFDGVRFTVFSKADFKNLASNRFTGLFAEADGTLWISTEESGLACYRNGEFQFFTTADGLGSNEVFQVQRDLSGDLLMFNRNGLTRFRDGRFLFEREADFRNYKVYFSPSGSLWEINEQGLNVRRSDRSDEENFDLPFDKGKIAADRNFNYIGFVAMLEDRDGALWLTASGNLYRLAGGTIETFTANNGMPSSRVRQIVQDRNGAIWLATEKDGICRFAENRARCFGTDKGLSSNDVMNLAVDREGTLWVGTNDRGINRVTPRLVSPLSVAEGLFDKNVYPILETKSGDIWIGTNSALSLFRNGKITNYTRREGLYYEIIQSLYEDRSGRLWIGGIGGVQYLENGKFYDFTEKLGLPIGDYNFLDIYQDRLGALWFATTKGLVKYSGETARLFTTDEGMPSNDIRRIYETRNGTLWIGTLGGAAFLERDSGRNAVGEKTEESFTALTEKGGVAVKNVREIYEDGDGVIWFGSYDGGLARMKDNKFTNYTTRDGLFSNGVFRILEDRRGNFWMSSNQGIFRVNKQELNDFADGKISAVVSTAYGKSDGMLNTECNGGRQPAGIKTRDGKLWFPTQDGAAIINPEAVPFNPLAPPVLLEEILVNREKIQLENGAIVLQPNQTNLQIKYTGLSFIKPEQTRFRYRLEGLDEIWMNAGTRREAFYPYLPPGKYTFRVIAANSDNVWNEQGASIEIVVKPSFYQTWWFWVLCAFAIVIVAFRLYQRRLNEIRRRQFAQEDFSRRLINAHETERRRVAAELHDSIGQSLAMIKNSAVFGSNTANDLDEAKEQLAEISTQSAHAIAEVREISYNLRPYLLDRLGLTKAISALLEKIEDNSALEIISDIEDVDGLFENEAEISIYRIIQESLNNILKHAEATKVRVLMAKTARFVTIEIADNGKGFDVKAKSETKSRGGFGLLGMSERVRMLGGTQTIESETGKGTVIRINLHLPEKKKLS